MQPLIIPSSFDAYMSGAQAKEQATQAKRQKQFGELISQSFTAENKNPLLQQAAALNPQGALQFGQYFQDQSQIQQKQAEEKDKQQALSTLRKVEVLDTAPAERIVPLYQQIAPEHYAQVTQQLGRPPTPQEIKETIAMHKADLYAKSGITPPNSSTAKVHSTFVGKNGNMWVVPQEGGVPKDTGIPAQQFAPKVIQTDTGTYSYNPTNEKLGAPLLTADQQNKAAATKVAATTAAKTVAEGKAKAGLDLPRIEENARNAVDVLNQLETHPGLQYITGAYSLAPIVPGTPQAAADALAQQVQGTTFLEAYQSLKGGGQITEVEGKKAESAIARLQRRQSTEDYKKALRDLKDVISSGLQRARSQAGSAPAQAQPQQQEITATGPNGQKIVLRNGQWVPYGQ